MQTRDGCLDLLFVFRRNDVVLHGGTERPALFVCVQHKQGGEIGRPELAEEPIADLHRDGGLLVQAVAEGIVGDHLCREAGLASEEGDVLIGQIGGGDILKVGRDRILKFFVLGSQLDLFADDDQVARFCKPRVEKDAGGGDGLTVGVVRVENVEYEVQARFLRAAGRRFGVGDLVCACLIGDGFADEGFLAQALVEGSDDHAGQGTTVPLQAAASDGVSRNVHLDLDLDLCRLHVPQDRVLGAGDEVVLAVDLEKEIRLPVEKEVLEVGGCELDAEGASLAGHGAADEVGIDEVLVPGLDPQPGEPQPGLAVNDATGDVESLV